MKQFVNAELSAPNAKTIPLDSAIIAEFTDPHTLPGKLISVAPDRDRWNSDIEWISPDDETGFAFFESAFERLGIPGHAAPYLDIDREVRLYIGFLVARSRCAKPYFHTDWKQLNNEAFTVLTPVSANAEKFGLLYGKLNGQIGDYDYRRGEGILFGDDFVHSTKPGRSDEPVVLLCFQFGSDKMEYWPAILPQLETQATQVKRPDGMLMRTGVVASRAVT
jgi:hypothetical protein